VFPGSKPASQDGNTGSKSTDAVILQRVRFFLLAFVMMILGARPLFPSEGAELGDGIAVIMLLLGGIVVSMTFFLGKPRVSIRFGWIDIAVLIVVLLAIVASIRGALVGTTRPAINMAWEWLGYGLIWIFIRQLRLNPKERRMLLAGMAAIAVGVASYGLYQYLVEFPMMREEFQRHRSEWLHSLGWDDLQTNPVWLAQFENRLYSREPLGTFALANSLAGFLLPWMTLLIAILPMLEIVAFRFGQAKGNETQSHNPSNATRSHNPRRSVSDFLHVSRVSQFVWAAGLLSALALTGTCLVLTKSRSAYAAFFVAVLILFASSRAMWQRQWRIAVGIVATVLVVAMGAAVFLRGLDWAVLSEAGKSLTYRWQYWTATTEMIRDMPLLGCGPGNFRYAYLRYKLPEASEEVSDPHNFVLELAANVGIPGALALCLGLLGTASQLVRAHLRGYSDHGPEAFSGAGSGLHGERVNEGKDTPRLILAPEVLAIGVGWVLAWPAGWLFGLLSSAPQTGTIILVGCPVAFLCLLAFWPWINGGRWTPIMALASLIALGTHWLAAGGLTFPGVAYSFWLIWALSQDLIDEKSPTRQASASTFQSESVVRRSVSFLSPHLKEVSLSGIWTYVTCAVLGVTGFLCYFTAYAPVLDARGLMAEAARIKNISHFKAEELLRAAAKADPWAYEPWLRMLELWVEAIRSEGNQKEPWQPKEVEKLKTSVTELRIPRANELQEYAVNLLKRARNHHAVYWNLAIAYQELAQATENREALGQAIEYAQQAITLYPNQATYHVGYAEMLLKSGRLHEAQAAAKKALWLHEVTPHQDRKLPEETVANLKAILQLSRTEVNTNRSAP